MTDVIGKLKRNESTFFVLQGHRYTFERLNDKQVTIFCTSLNHRSSCGGHWVVPSAHEKLIHDVLKAVSP